jgi:hypothetical protein
LGQGGSGSGAGKVEDEHDYIVALQTQKLEEMRKGMEADERNAYLASNYCQRGEDGLRARRGRTGILCPRFGDTGA